MKCLLVLSSNEEISDPHSTYPSGATIISRMISPSRKSVSSASILDILGFSLNAFLIAPDTPGKLVIGVLCLSRKVFVNPAISAITHSSSSRAFIKPSNTPILCWITVNPSKWLIAGSFSANAKTLSQSSLSSFRTWGTGPLAPSSKIAGSQPKSNSQAFTWGCDPGLGSSCTTSVVGVNPCSLK